MNEITEVGRFFNVTYLGSPPDHAATIESAPLVFTSDGMWLVKGEEGRFFVPWTDIRQLSADEREVVERRVTVPRVFLLGVGAWIAKKERVFAYLAVVDDTG